jgi:hypothetical protein
MDLVSSRPSSACDFEVAPGFFPGGIYSMHGQDQECTQN